MTCRVCSAPDMSKMTSTAKACSMHVGVDVLVVAIGTLRGRSVNSMTLCRSEGPFYVVSKNRHEDCKCMNTYTEIP